MFDPSKRRPSLPSSLFYRHGIFRPLVTGRALIVGVAGAARPLAAALARAPRPPFVVAGMLETDMAPEGGIAVLDTPSGLVGAVSRHHIDTVVICLRGMGPETLAQLIVLAGRVPVELLVTDGAQTSGRAPAGSTFLAGYTLRRLGYPPISGLSAGIKRGMDLVLGTLLLLVFAPVMIVLAIVVKLDSPGPALFLQQRFGFNRTVFRLCKFRTMTVESTDPDARMQTSRDDARRTRVGAFIRRHSLDELPQLLNVLKGEMSIVGPRPHALGTSTEGKLLEDALETYIGRLRVKPGITGWAQVNGSRGELSSMERLEARVALDLHYIANWSLLLDLRILVMTAGCLFHDGDAY